jgi:hypothetical protein
VPREAFLALGGNIKIFLAKYKESYDPQYVPEQCSNPTFDSISATAT